MKEKIALKQKKKTKFIDDGRTIYSMDGLSKKSKKQDDLDLTKSERRTIILAAFKVYLPRLLLILIGFGIAYILLYLWLM